MEARITFRSEIFIKGKDINEIRQKWEYMPIFCADALEDASANVIDVVSVEDSSTYEDLSDEFD